MASSVPDPDKATIKIRHTKTNSDRLETRPSNEAQQASSSNLGRGQLAANQPRTRWRQETARRPHRTWKRKRALKTDSDLLCVAWDAGCGWLGLVPCHLGANVIGCQWLEVAPFTVVGRGLRLWFPKGSAGGVHVSLQREQARSAPCSSLRDGTDRTNRPSQTLPVFAWRTEELNECQQTANTSPPAPPRLSSPLPSTFSFRTRFCPAAVIVAEPALPPDVARNVRFPELILGESEVALSVSPRRPACLCAHRSAPPSTRIPRAGSCVQHLLQHPPVSLVPPCSAVSPSLLHVAAPETPDSTRNWPGPSAPPAHQAIPAPSGP